jgi:hypothetical protein
MSTPAPAQAGVWRLGASEQLPPALGDRAMRAAARPKAGQ